MFPGDSQHDHQQMLATAFRALWEGTHGRLAGNVRVWVGTHSLAVWAEGVSHPGDRAVQSQPGDHRLLQQSAEQLLAAIRPGLWDQVETITGRHVVSGHARTDVLTGHLLCFFVLDDCLSEAVSQTSGEN